MISTIKTLYRLLLMLFRKKSFNSRPELSNYTPDKYTSFLEEFNKLQAKYGKDIITWGDEH